MKRSVGAFIVFLVIGLFAVVITKNDTKESSYVPDPPLHTLIQFLNHI